MGSGGSAVVIAWGGAKDVIRKRVDMEKVFAKNKKMNLCINFLKAEYSRKKKMRRDMKAKRNDKHLSIFLFFVITTALLQSATVKSDDLLIVARRWIAANAVFQSELPDAEIVMATHMTNVDGAELPLWHVKLSPSGYLIMSSDDTLPPVVAFDTKASFSQLSPTPLPLILDRQGEIFHEELLKPQTRGNRMAQANQARWNALRSPTRATSVNPSTIITPVMLKTEWNQTPAPYNYLCPSNYTYVDRAAAGCVPIAIAQILKYHEWPPVGIGSKSYRDSKNNLKARLKADFSFPYDWGNMQESYSNSDEDDITNAELQLSRLIMEIGVLVEADYELKGTGAYPVSINDHLYQYLNYSNTAQYGSAISNQTGYVGTSTLYSRLREDMLAKRPSLASYENDEGAHMFVVDGLGTILDLEYYHFNYGWGGAQNGWYLLTDGYEETVVCQSTTNIIPAPVAIFKPMSVEQASSFTLRWDFPGRLPVEEFCLTRSNGGETTVIYSEIDGSQRSCHLTGQTGTNTYTLKAKINGEWQDASDAITIVVKNTPSDAVPYLSLNNVLESIGGSITTTSVSSTYPLKSLTVTSGRPDILPDSAISTTKNGANWAITLSPNTSAYGNILLYLTATDTVGNTIKQNAVLKTMKADPLTWQTQYSQALRMAQETGKRILLVKSTYPQAEYCDFCQKICEMDEIKKCLLDNYVLWYVPTNNDWDAYVFTIGLDKPLPDGAYPHVAIIDPNDTSRRVDGKNNPSAEDFFDFVNPDMVFFSLDDEESHPLDVPCQLELKCYRKNAIIRYRFDSSTLTSRDAVYDAPIPLTKNTTVSARAFLNGKAIGKTVTKTYTFQSKVATPVLDKQPLEFFTGSCLLKASCNTPDAVIRYTIDGQQPQNLYSPIFPEDGLEISKSCTLIVRAFKNGMKDSSTVSCRLIEQAVLPESDTILNRKDINIYWEDDPWILQADTFHTKPSALQSPQVYRGKSTSMTTKVNGPGVIEFHWKAIGESEDEFVFFIDGIPKSYSEGDMEWNRQSYMISDNGDHYLKWTFSISSNSYADKGSGFVDDISWKTLASIDISGDDVIGVADSAQYTCTATWSDETTTIVTPKWYLSSTEHASVDDNGVVTNKNSTGSDQTVTLEASFFDDMATSTTMDILLDTVALPQVATPSLNAYAWQFFTGRYSLKATCATPNAVIRYTTNGDNPTQNSPLFPSKGLTVTETTEITARAFKDGMKSSESSQRLLIPVKTIPELADGPGIVLGFMDSPWFLQSKTYKSSPSAMQSPSVKGNESTTMAAIVSGPGVISFNWKISSVSGVISFSLDGIPIATVYDNADWSHQSVTISAEGDHCMTWTYRNNSSIARTSDSCWVDDVSWIRAEDMTSENAFEYSISYDSITITKFMGDQTNVFIPASIGGCPVVKIGDSAFENCVGVKKVSIPPGVYDIGNRAFAGCSSLVNISLPNSLQEIGDMAFSIRNGKLKTINIPASVNHIGEAPFGYSSNLLSIVVDENNTRYVSQDGVLYDKDMTCLIQYPAGKTNPTYEVPDSVELIGNVALGGCKYLTSIVIPENVKAICLSNSEGGGSAHPEGMLIIDDKAFDECTNLATIIFKGALHDINPYAFPTPITFFVQEGMGWEDYIPPEGVTVEFDLTSLLLKLSKGWNLCSMPFMPDEESVSLLKKSGVCWGWVNGRFKQMDNFLPGQGFWMYVSSACKLRLKGDNGEPLPLRKGWNLVGPTNANPSFGDTIFWGMEGMHMIHLSPYAAENVKRGNGYWIFVK